MPPELSSTPSEFVVKARMGGKRVDAYLASRYPDFSRSVIQKVIDARAVHINGQPTKASYKVREGDAIRIWLPELSDEPPAAEDIPLRIVYEDAAFTVVDKRPRGTGPGRWSTPSSSTSTRSPPSAASTGRGSSTGSTATPRAS